MAAHETSRLFEPPVSVMFPTMAETPLDEFPAELTEPAAQLRPESFFAAMHEQSPVRWDDTRGCWDVFGYEAVRTVAADNEAFSVRMDANPDFDEGGDDPPLLAESMLHADPPRHDRLRSVVDQWFTPAAVGERRDAIERAATALLDDVLDEATSAKSATTFDLVDDFAYPLTVETIAETIGVPPSDRDHVREWTKFAMAAGDSDGSLPALLEYFETLEDRRREDSTDDLASDIAAAEHLSSDELRDVFMVILLGGLSTTVLIANAVWSLFEADAITEVRNGGYSLDTVINETLRHRSPVQAHSRYAVERTTVGDVTVEAGDKLCVWYAAANHDPATFEEPATFDLDRDADPHLAFGTGTHFCLGARLARLEATIALRTLFDRTETVSVDTDALEPTGSVLLRGPSTMPTTSRPDYTRSSST